MKRALVVAAFSVVGPIYLLATIFIVAQLVPASGSYRFGEDEANRYLVSFFAVAIPLFTVLWGWVGSVFWNASRRGLLAIGGILCGTGVVFAAGALFEGLMNHGGSVVNMKLLALAYPLFWFVAAGGLGFLFSRPSSRPAR